MTKDEALDLALEALEKSLPRLAPYGEQDWLDSRAAITAIKQALAAPTVGEPVAWCTKSDLENMAKGFSQDVPARSMRVPQLYPEGNTVLLYTTPQEAQPAPVQPVQTVALADEVIGCFHAAEIEGLTEALANTTDEHLKDLVERRLMYALYAAQESKEKS